MNGTTIQAPPIPQVPPPTCYAETLNKMNISVNPLVSSGNQENFYHTLTTHNNIPSMNPNQMAIDDQNPYSDYNSVTMNLRAQLLLKQQQQQQQQQFFINTLRAMNMKNHQQSYMETHNPKSPSMTHSMRRNTSISSSKKSKKSNRRDKSSDRSNQLDENFIQTQIPSNYYLMPQTNQMVSIEAALAAQNQLLFNQSALNQPGIYLLNNYLPTESLMFNNMFSNQGSQMTEQSIGEIKSTVDDVNRSMTIEEQEKEPLQSGNNQ